MRLIANYFIIFLCLVLIENTAFAKQGQQIEDILKKPVNEVSIKNYENIYQFLTNELNGKENEFDNFYLNLLAGKNLLKIREKIILDINKYNKWPSCANYFMYYEENKDIPIIENLILKHIFESYSYIPKIKKDYIEKATISIAQTSANILDEYIKNINFESGSATISKICESRIERFSELLKKIFENIEAKVMIIGHTDSVGSKEGNFKLSLKRAQSVKNFLICKGHASISILIKGRGEEDPIVSNDTKVGRFLNRRIETKFIIIEK